MIKDYNTYKNINEAEVVQNPVPTDESENNEITSLIKSVSNKLKNKLKKSKGSNKKSKDGVELVNDNNEIIITDKVYIIGRFTDSDNNTNHKSGDMQEFGITLTGYDNGAYSFKFVNDIDINVFEAFRYDGDKLPNDKTNGSYIIVDSEKIDMILKPTEKTVQKPQAQNTQVQVLQDETIKSEYTKQDILNVSNDIKNNLDKYSEKELYTKYLEIFKWIMNSTSLTNDDRLNLIKSISVKNLIDKYPSFTKLDNTRKQYLSDIKSGKFKDIYVDKSAQTDKKGIDPYINSYIEELKSDKELDDKYIVDTGNYIIKEITNATISDKEKAYLYDALINMIGSDIQTKYPKTREIFNTATKNRKQLE